MARKIRVVVAKPGLDGHDRGAKIIARALRDAGMEVIYTGLHQTPEQIVETVLQEDADAVGLSILSGAHMTLVPRIVELLRAQDADDVVVTVGGTIPNQDIPELKALGVAEVFTPGAPTQAIIDFIEGAVGASVRPTSLPPDGIVDACRPVLPRAARDRLRGRRDGCSEGLRRLLPAHPAGDHRRRLRISFWLLALVLKDLSVGTTYAIWSAVGTAAVALIGIAAYGETASVLKIASLGLIVLGVIGLNAAGAH